MYFDRTKSILAQIKLYKNVATRAKRLIKSYEKNFSAIDKIYSQLCTIFVIKLLINICLTYERKQEEAMQYTHLCSVFLMEYFDPDAMIFEQFKKQLDNIVKWDVK